MATRAHSRLRRACFAAACVLGVFAVALHAAHRHDVGMITSLARELDRGRSPGPAERLETYVRYANRSLRNPRYTDLHPLWVRLYYRLNPLHPGPGDVLRWGCDYRGACGSHVRVVVAMLLAAGIPSHHLQILDPQGRRIHSVVQAEIGGRWVVADALYGIVYRRRDGALATVEDLNRDRPNFLSQVRGVRGYDSVLYDFDSVTSFNWNKIPVLLPAVRRLLVGIMGEDRVSRLSRPQIWMWPQEFYSMVCAALAAACLAAGLLVRPSAARVPARGRPTTT